LSRDKAENALKTYVTALERLHAVTVRDEQVFLAASDNMNSSTWGAGYLEAYAKCQIPALKSPRWSGRRWARILKMTDVKLLFGSGAPPSALFDLPHAAHRERC
jgi:hypothetical protein